MSAKIWIQNKTCDGYTIFPGNEGTVLIDMRGEIVHEWKGIAGFPNKLDESTGVLYGTTGIGTGFGVNKDQRDLVGIDKGGHIISSLGSRENMLRQHHDFQIHSQRGRLLVLTHENELRREISRFCLTDDVILEFDTCGKLLWKWNARDHISEFGFSHSARRLIDRMPGIREDALGDWLHINAAVYIGENRWWEAKDERFCPDNILITARVGGFIGIIDRKTGMLVWKVGPNYDLDSELGYIHGPHGAYLIPPGLPGEGNVLLADSGVVGNYLTKAQILQIKKHGVCSRVIEFCPRTQAVLWSYGTKQETLEPYSYAQRLPNGNTLVTIARKQSIIEITKEGEVVWKYQYPAGENKIECMKLFL